MTRRLLFSLALAVASSFALTAAVPAYACNGDCDCAKKQTAPKADKKAADPKPADKEAKPAVEKKASLAPAAQGALLAADEDCKCEKGGKNCTCKKGACKCANCGKGDKEEKAPEKAKA